MGNFPGEDFPEGISEEDGFGGLPGDEENGGLPGDEGTGRGGKMRAFLVG